MTKGTAKPTVPFPVSSQLVSSNWNLYTVFITGIRKIGWRGRTLKREKVAPFLVHFLTHSKNRSYCKCNLNKDAESYVKKGNDLVLKY